ncbi:MAG: choice-of-anchor V domain-containing protein, partial [Bacteroidia bacterium]
GTTFQSDMISIDVPDCGYIPGETYTVTLTVSSAGRNEFGFSVSPQFNGGATAGTMIASEGTQLNGSGRYLTHTAQGTAETSPNARIWTFEWIAPPAGSGDVTFYAAFNASNNNNANSGDLIFNSNLTIFEGVTPEPPNIFGNNVVCAGTIASLSTNYTSGIVWSPGNQTTQSIETEAQGTYQVTVTNECGTATSQPFNLSFEDAPPAPSIEFNISTGAFESSVVGPYFYAWFLNGNLLQDSVGASIIPNIVGDYTLQITTFNGCSSAFSEPLNPQTVSIPTTQSTNGFELLQNPIHSQAIVDFKGTERAAMEVYSVSGKHIKTFVLYPGINNLSLNIKSGTYILRANNSVKRLVVLN